MSDHNSQHTLWLELLLSVDDDGRDASFFYQLVQGVQLWIALSSIPAGLLRLSVLICTSIFITACINSTVAVPIIITGMRGKAACPAGRSTRLLVNGDSGHLVDERETVPTSASD